MDVQSVLIGTPARDGQFDPPPACSVCGAAPVVATGPTGHTLRSELLSVPAWPGWNKFRHVCRGCLGRAMQAVGPGRGPEALNTRTCSGWHRGDDGDRFAVAAEWPLRSFGPPPYWLACVRHLNEALDALSPEREGTSHAVQ
jgi:hypothetical protein